MRNGTMSGGLILAGLLAAVAVTGCTQNQPATPPVNTVVNTAPATPPATTTTVTPGATTTTTANSGGPDTKINTNAGPGTSNGTDTATADAVNTAIVHNKQMTGSRVEVVVTSGVARLNGTVQSQQQKALAATTASNTPGVSSVRNKLQIVATGGAHGTATKPKTIVKVFNHTTVVHDTKLVPVPSDNANGGTDNSGGNGGSNTANGGSDNGANPPASPNTTATPGNNP